MVKKLLVLLVLVGILISGCSKSPLELTEETKKYCEQDSDCGIQFTCCCFEALNKKYMFDIECKKDILCSPCPWSKEDTLIKCINHQCKLVSKLEYCEKEEDCMDIFRSCSCKYECFPKNNLPEEDCKQECPNFEDEQIPSCECSGNKCLSVVNFDILEPNTPYTSSDLGRLTKIVDKNNDLNKKIVNDIFNILRYEVKTFIGKKYVRFDPKLELVRYYEPSDYREFSFRGEGYVDDDTYDNYHIRIIYQNGNAKILENAVAWKGVPEKYKQLAIDVVEREEPEIIEKTTKDPHVRWMPEQYGNLSLLFVSPSGEPESPHAWVIFDLEKKKIISLKKEWWD